MLLPVSQMYECQMYVKIPWLISISEKGTVPFVSKVSVFLKRGSTSVCNSGQNLQDNIIRDANFL